MCSLNVLDRHAEVHLERGKGSSCSSLSLSLSLSDRLSISCNSLHEKIEVMNLVPSSSTNALMNKFLQVELIFLLSFHFSPSFNLFKLKQFLPINTPNTPSFCASAYRCRSYGDSACAAVSSEFISYAVVYRWWS